jgi:hypothetical protein
MANGTRIGFSGGCDDLEQLVRDAGRVVVASDDLRPKVTQAARASDLRASQWVKLRNLCLCAGCFWLVALLLLMHISGSRSSLVGPSSQEMELRSLRYANQRHYSMDWGMVDAFSELRSGSPLIGNPVSDQSNDRNEIPESFASPRHRHVSREE